MKLSKTFKLSVMISALFFGLSSSVIAGQYTVKAGDTLYKISVAQGVNYDALVKANPQITDVNVIHSGAKLNLPGAGCENDPAYLKAVADANAALDKAKSVKSEWRDARWKKSKFVKYKTPDGKTTKSSFMGAAAIAAKHCDTETAMKLLKTAKFQGEMGYQQGMEQKSAGPQL